VRFKWNEGDIAFWDNRSTVHLAPTDIFESDFDRQLFRVTLVGKPLVGVDGQPSKSIEGEPILSGGRAKDVGSSGIAIREVVPWPCNSSPTGGRSRLGERRGLAERLDPRRKQSHCRLARPRRAPSLTCAWPRRYGTDMTGRGARCRRATTGAVSQMALDDSAQLVDWDHEQVVALVIEQRGPTRPGEDVVDRAFLPVRLVVEPKPLIAGHPVG
jgi:hypothetical protein